MNLMCELNILNILFSLPVGLITYILIEWILHCKIAENCGIPKKEKSVVLWLEKLSGKTFLTIFSVGYAFSDYYKGDARGRLRRRFIQQCNRCNLIISLLLMAVSFFVVFMEFKLLIPFITGINCYRFISRSLEIVVAFSKDVFRTYQNRSHLRKFQRLKLAMNSYLEIYLYSASFYVVLITADYAPATWKALVMTISIGTLTNVAYSQEIKNLSSFLQLFPFIQVIATLSLVVLSLTMYISRKS